jgi:ABC-type sugar transport system permease subunit
MAFRTFQIGQAAAVSVLMIGLLIACGLLYAAVNRRAQRA